MAKFVLFLLGTGFESNGSLTRVEIWQLFQCFIARFAFFLEEREVVRVVPETFETTQQIFFFLDYILS